ncbi:Uncharacterised protein (plasmid) [Mesomycoplasma conjunctivae]|nr:Uncharacterised protein [Mesomycoplasma conjunctivae]
MKSLTPFLKNLQKTLNKYGWKDLKINFEQKTMVSVDNGVIEEENKRTLEFMKKWQENQEKLTKKMKELQLQIIRIDEEEKAMKKLSSKTYLR